jgi:putative N6-adenine-specific DNA methylase
MAALFLRQCKFTGSETVLDPMCGSGTFVIEAAEMAAGLWPGRNRHFAFELLANFDAAAWQALRAAVPQRSTAQHLYGSDRDAGAITAAKANAERAGVGEFCSFEQNVISAISPPPGPPGLVILNPPYGARIGDKKKLMALYASVGKVLRERFSGWRLGLIVNDDALARATGLKLHKGMPILHGGLRVWLHQGQL